LTESVARRDKCLATVYRGLVGTKTLSSKGETEDCLKGGGEQPFKKQQALRELDTCNAAESDEGPGPEGPKKNWWEKNLKKKKISNTCASSRFKVAEQKKKRRVGLRGIT